MIGQSKKIISLLLSKPFETDTQEGRAKERARRIGLTAITAAISKVLSTIIPFITVRLTLDYLGVELYGLWNAVTSFFALFVFADLGLGNGLQTQLSRACGNDDLNLQRKIVFNCYVVLSVVSLFMILIFTLVYPFVDWAKLMNASDTDVKYIVGSIIWAIVAPKFAAIPLSLIQRVQLAYQEGYNSNLWQCVASVLNLISIWLICHFNLGKMAIIWATALLPLFIFGMNSLVYYTTRKHRSYFTKSNFSLELIKSLLQNGMLFFILSLFTTAGLAIDTFIVAHVDGLEDATSFSILHRIAVLISMVVGMLCTPLWSANGEALARGDKDWVRRNTFRMTRVSSLFALTISILLLAFSHLFFRIWLGADFKFSLFCLAGMCITQIILSAISPFFMVLNAANEVKKQIYIFSIFTVLTLLLKFWFAQYYGANVIPWISAVCYVICIVPFVITWSNKILK